MTSIQLVASVEPSGAARFESILEIDDAIELELPASIVLDGTEQEVGILMVYATTSDRRNASLLFSALERAFGNGNVKSFDIRQQM